MSAKSVWIGDRGYSKRPAGAATAANPGSRLGEAAAAVGAASARAHARAEAGRPSHGGVGDHVLVQRRATLKLGAQDVVLLTQQLHLALVVLQLGACSDGRLEGGRRGSLMHYNYTVRRGDAAGRGECKEAGAAACLAQTGRRPLAERAPSELLWSKASAWPGVASPAPESLPAPRLATPAPSRPTPLRPQAKPAHLPPQLVQLVALLINCRLLLLTEAPLCETVLLARVGKLPVFLVALLHLGRAPPRLAPSGKAGGRAGGGPSLGGGALLQARPVGRLLEAAGHGAARRQLAQSERKIGVLVAGLLRVLPRHGPTGTARPWGLTQSLPGARRPPLLSLPLCWPLLPSLPLPPPPPMRPPGRPRALPA
jgi:hypothetical protein